MIALCPNPFRDTCLTLTLQAEKLLRDAGFETVICPVFAEDSPEALPKGLITRELHEVIPDCRLLIVLGGDGTILAVARSVQGESVPILGVNMGTKGFMTALEPEDIEYIVRAAKGDYEISSRMMLDVQICRDGEVIYGDCALNDVVIHGYGDCIQLTTWSDEDMINSFSGDGIIVATPTGSTGYSMSAGGPIVEPEAENFIISPICAHVMSSRSYVLDPMRRVTIKTEKLHDRRAYLSVDGNSVLDIANGDIITVTKSENYTLMANVGLKSFYEIIYEKIR